MEKPATEARRLFTANLAPDVTEKDLIEEFSYFGGVRSLKIIEGKGIGFVTMYHPGDAERARIGLNGIDFHGRRIRVERALSRRKKS
jgi:RNA recognition motif-containing protein